MTNRVSLSFKDVRGSDLMFNRRDATKPETIILRLIVANDFQAGSIYLCTSINEIENLADRLRQIANDLRLSEEAIA